MKSRERHILLAGSEEEIAALATLLESRGFSVELCKDGSAALEGALRSHPGLIIVSTALSGMSAERLGQVLRANPHLSDVAFYFVGRDGDQVEGFQRHRDHYIVRPFNADQVAGEVATYFVRRARARQFGGQEKEIEGNLGQIALIDLLQIFALNHKNGILKLSRKAEQGTLFLDNGHVVNASLGKVDGEKAVYRLLRWEEGKFWFFPGKPEVEKRIAAATDHLIMEGLRQNDEMIAQAGQLPRPEAHLALRIPRDRLPQGMRPSTQEVLLKLEYYPLVADLLDQCMIPDFEILQLLKLLIEKGVVEERQGETAKSKQKQVLLGSSQLLTLRERLGDRNGLTEQGSAKLLLAASQPAQLRQFVQALQGTPEFEPDDAFLQAGQELALGDIGQIALSEIFLLRIFSLPSSAAMAPLWPVFAKRCIGVAILGPKGSMPEIEAHFAKRPEISVAYVGFEAAPQVDFVLARGDRGSLRSLLTFFADRTQAGGPKGES
jgi:DNA-binding response OmpR family regulator